MFQIETLNSRFSGDFDVVDQVNANKMLRSVSQSKKIIGKSIAFAFSASFVALLIAILYWEHNIWDKLKVKAFQHQLWDQQIIHSIARRLGITEDDALTRGFALLIGVLTGIQIKLVDAIWDAISDSITDLEFKRLYESFQMSKRIKTCAVKFLTSVYTFVFIAFVQPVFMQEDAAIVNQNVGNTRLLLQSTIFGIMFTRYVVLGAVNRLQPLVQSKLCGLFRVAKDRYRDQVESEAKLLKYTGTDLDHDMLDVLVPLCILMLFGTSIWTFAGVLLVLCNFVQFYADSRKFTQTQRPLPRTASSVEFFNSFLEFTGHFMIFSNFAMIFFFYRPNENSDSDTRVIAFHDAALYFGCCLFGVLLWHLIAWICPEISDFCAIELRRHKVQIQALANKAGGAHVLPLQIQTNSKVGDDLGDIEGKLMAATPGIKIPEEQESGRYGAGDQVQVWSNSRQEWLDGTVVVAPEEEAVIEGYRVTPGCLKVQSPAGMKWLLPEAVAMEIKKLPA